MSIIYILLPIALLLGLRFLARFYSYSMQDGTIR